jgi:V/A-type H+-transporting ATPase subunit I
MLRTVPMRRVLVLVPHACVDAVIEAVAALGVLHLLDLSEREEWSWAVRPYDVEEALRSRRETLRRIDALLRFFAPPPPRGPVASSLPEPSEIEGRVETWIAEMEALRSEREQLRQEIEELARGERSAAALAPTGLELGQLSEMRVLQPACGWIAADDLPRLEEVLARIPHRVVTAAAHGDQRLIVAFALARDREALERALRSTGWEPLALPAPGDMPSAEAYAAIGRRRRATEERLRALESRIAERREELGDLLLLEARAFTSRSESVVFLAGWAPAERVEALGAAVRRATDDRCYVAVQEPSSVDAVRAGAEPVPILFRNPALVRPFERLTAAYGAPRWGEIDPTPIVAVAFWIMFGLMFGDVGHGLVLAGAGFWIFRRVVRYRDYGVILMECGLASAAFGFAYGSVFGLENVVPALWFRPMEDVPRLLRVGAIFGLGFVSLSFALGVLNAVLRRDWRGAFTGSHGLLAALAYWTAAALGLRWLATGEIGIGAGLVASLLGTPLALLWGLRVAEELRRVEGPPEARPGLVAAVLGGAVEVVDLVVRGVANTVSFVRLAAFAVSHAGLLLAVFALEETVSGTPGGTLWGALVILVGNLVIIALEGLIVSIQSVRLVYYEFFSHFHEGTGLGYRPLQLRFSPIQEEIR